MRLIEIELPTDARRRFPTTSPRSWPTPKLRLQQYDAKFQASIPAFVPSDFELVYHALAWINDVATRGRPSLSRMGQRHRRRRLPRRAARLRRDRHRDRSRRWCEIAESLAADHDIDVEFACGSYVPSGAEPFVDTAGEVTWLRTDRPDSYADLDLEPEDFDLIYAYPWPGEEQVIFDLFDDSAAVGSLLLTYHSQDGLRLQRKVRR